MRYAVVAFTPLKEKASSPLSDDIFGALLCLEHVCVDDVTVFDADSPGEEAVIGALHPKSPKGPIGRHVTAKEPDLDNDENGNERPIPAGTRGVVSRLNHTDSAGVRHYDVYWANGGWTVYSEPDLLTLGFN